MSRRVDAGPADRADGSDDSEYRAVKLSQLEVQVALTSGPSKFEFEAAERPTGGRRCRRLANSTGRQPKRGPRVVTVDTSDASGSEEPPAWGATSSVMAFPNLDVEFLFCLRDMSLCRCLFVVSLVVDCICCCFLKSLSP